MSDARTLSQRIAHIRDRLAQYEAANKAYAEYRSGPNRVAANNAYTKLCGATIRNLPGILALMDAGGRMMMHLGGKCGLDCSRAAKWKDLMRAPAETNELSSANFDKQAKLSDAANALFDVADEHHNKEHPEGDDCCSMCNALDEYQTAAEELNSG